MTLFSFMYIVASNTEHHVHYFSCVYTYILLVVIYVLLSRTCHICITFLNMSYMYYFLEQFPLIFVSLNAENVRECCKVQRVV